MHRMRAFGLGWFDTRQTNASPKGSKNMHDNSLVLIAIRIAVLLAVPIYHFLYHKYGEKLIHHSLHRFNMVRFKYLSDVLMVGALLVLHLVESHLETE